jgi:hypothetical protein
MVLGFPHGIKPIFFSPLLPLLTAAAAHLSPHTAAATFLFSLSSQPPPAISVSAVFLTAAVFHLCAGISSTRRRSGGRLVARPPGRRVLPVPARSVRSTAAGSTRSARSVAATPRPRHRRSIRRRHPTPAPAPSDPPAPPAATTSPSPDLCCLRHRPSTVLCCLRRRPSTVLPVRLHSSGPGAKNPPPHAVQQPEASHRCWRPLGCLKGN